MQGSAQRLLLRQQHGKLPAVIDAPKHRILKEAGEVIRGLDGCDMGSLLSHLACLRTTMDKRCLSPMRSASTTQSCVKTTCVETPQASSLLGLSHPSLLFTPFSSQVGRVKGYSLQVMVLLQAPHFPSAILRLALAAFHFSKSHFLITPYSSVALVAL